MRLLAPDTHVSHKAVEAGRRHPSASGPVFLATTAQYIQSFPYTHNTLTLREASKFLLPVISSWISRFEASRFPIVNVCRDANATYIVPSLRRRCRG